MSKALFCCLVLILVGAACSRQSLQSKPAVQSSPPVSAQSSPRPTPIDGRPVTELIQQQPFLEKQKKSALLQTWKRIPNHAVYQAIASDYGEIAGAYGLIVFMFDKTRVENRHSVVIFLERPENRYSLHWIKRDEDLSRVGLHRHSGNVYLAENDEGGAGRYCDVQWSRATGKWGCDLSRGQN